MAPRNVRSDRGAAALFRADADALFQVRDEDLAVADLPGPVLGRAEDGVDGYLHERVVAGEGKFGLFLVNELLTLSGMTITETGEPGKGARFEMTVPNGAWRMAGNGA